MLACCRSDLVCIHLTHLRVAQMPYMAHDRPRQGDISLRRRLTNEAIVSKMIESVKPVGRQHPLRS